MKEVLPKLIKKQETKKPVENMTPFCKEIAKYVTEYKSGKINGTMYDLTLIENLNHLKDEDGLMWKKINNYESNPISPEKLNLEEFELYQKNAKNFNEEFELYQKNVEDSKNPSRYQFRSFLTQRWSSIWLNIQGEEYRRKKKLKK